VRSIEPAHAHRHLVQPPGAQAILDMRLGRLTGLERDKLEAEYRELWQLTGTKLHRPGGVGGDDVNRGSGESTRYPMYTGAGWLK
jgi:hypothetical protein